MPQIKIDHVVSFSSEDPVHVANNMLSTDPVKKWKCKSAGEKTATIVLQLEKASQITGIDIGNENSAYIEVLVSRLGSNEDFKVLLVMSSFMTPLEARQSQNPNKTRMFKHQELMEPERDQKWDRVKVVCTQPFNRHVQYGLSFIIFHSNDQPIKNSAQATIGKFLIRPESPDDLGTGSLFARRKELQQEEKQETLKGAAAIRLASSSESLAQYGSPKCKPKLIQTAAGCSTPKNKKDDKEKNTPQSRNREELLYSKDEEERNEKIDKKIEKKAKEKEQTTTPKPSKEKKPNSSKESHKRKRSEEKGRKNKREKQSKPFGRLLEGVAIVISGIQNPDRANLRGMALAMGAKYKPDWDNSCTHLICAFANTPKFNQVRGKGKIVTKKWIEDCHNQRKRLPWRRYALDKNDEGNESEEEIFEEVKEKTPEKSSSENNNDTDEEGRGPGSDTEERIARILAKQKKPKNNNEENVFELDTESENEKSDNSENKLDFIKKFRSFFENKTFHIDQFLDRDLQSKIRQYITAYKGTITEEPTDTIDIIVTTNENAADFKEINQSATCVSPDWVWQCHNCQMLTPTDNFTF